MESPYSKPRRWNLPRPFGQGFLFSEANIFLEIIFFYIFALYI
nr:MAG TPA: hypothetical protein [Caudoviricetes sp.]